MTNSRPSYLLSFDIITLISTLKSPISTFWIDLNALRIEYRHLCYVMYCYILVIVFVYIVVVVV